MQDYPHFLVFARVYGDCRDPASPFFGTYTTGFALSPLLLPILATRGIASLSSFETGGRVLWTLYAVGLPGASLYLLRVLGRDRWAVLLVFPLVFSYWSVGGFFAFATSAPLLVLGLALGVRWLEAPTWPRGVALAAVVAALHLWHALAFAQVLFDFGVLWALARFDDGRARARALLPLAPGLALFAAWLFVTVHGRAPGSRPAAWPKFLDNAGQFFEFLGPMLPGAVGAAMILALLVASGALGRARPASGGSPARFRLANPFALLALLAALSFLVFPATCFGVEGIHNRQPWIAALLLVFAWSVPAGRGRFALLALLAAAGAGALVFLAGRFAAFERESGGASRLIDRLQPGDTLLAPIGAGSTASFPGKPLIAVELYATVRAGGLPNTSFAGYEINFIRYVGNRNPMPAIGGAWIDHPQLARFDYVLVRGAAGMGLRGHGPAGDRVRLSARDGDWSLYAVCGSRATPQCP